MDTHLFFTTRRARRVWLALALFPLLALENVLAADDATETVAPPALSDLRARGRVAVREWTTARRAADGSPLTAEAKELRASMELAGFVYHEAGGEVIDHVMAEAEEALARAQARTPDPKEKARQSANVGFAHERMAGRPAAARRHYEQALLLDPDDGVAKEGLARLERAERIDEQKEIEVERLKELEAFWAQQPRSRPSRTSTPLE